MALRYAIVATTLLPQKKFRKIRFTVTHYSITKNSFPLHFYFRAKTSR